MGEYGRLVRLQNDSIAISVAPELGFSLVSFRWRGLELLDPRLEADFLAIRKGLGPLILPHFNQIAAVPRVDKRAFPHIAGLEARGVKHPFQHGIGRYVPWEYSIAGDTVRGSIDGGMRWGGYFLSELACFDFNASVTYSLRADTLEIAFTLEGERPVAAGIHFYYNLFEKARAALLLSEDFTDGPARLDLGEALNQGFALKSVARSTEASCTLLTDSYSLLTRFPTGGAPERSFDTLVVFCPAEGNFACVEPISYPVGQENCKTRFLGSIRLQAGPSDRAG